MCCGPHPSGLLPSLLFMTMTAGEMLASATSQVVIYNMHYREVSGLLCLISSGASAGYRFLSQQPSLRVSWIWGRGEGRSC